jgi:heme-degrading monooxygenase HmoA
MYAMHNTLAMNPTLDATEFEAWARKALAGFRQREGFRGFFFLSGDGVKSGFFVTLWNSKQDLERARASAENRERRDVMGSMLEAPLDQCPCNVLLSHYVEDGVC